MFTESASVMENVKVGIKKIKKSRPDGEAVEEDEEARDLESDRKEGKQRPSVPCPYCDKVLSRRDKMILHVKSIHPDKEAPPTPVKAAKSKEDESKSKKKKSDKEGATETKKAKKKSTSDKDHKEGKKSEKKSDKVKIPCPYCGKLLSRRDKVYDHIKTVHPGSKLPNKIKVEKVSEKGKKGKEKKKEKGKKKKEEKGDKGKEKKKEKGKGEKDKKKTKSKEKNSTEKTAKKIKKDKKGKQLTKAGKSKLKIQKVKKKILIQDSSQVLARAMKKVWSSSDPVYVKFRFTKPAKRQRTDSEVSVELDFADGSPAKKLATDASYAKVKAAAGEKGAKKPFEPAGQQQQQHKTPLGAGKIQANSFMPAKPVLVNVGPDVLSTAGCYSPTVQRLTYSHSMMPGAGSPLDKLVKLPNPKKSPVNKSPVIRILEAKTYK